MRTRIQRWGNSLGLRIPKSFAEEAGVEAGPRSSSRFTMELVREACEAAQDQAA